MKSVFSPAEIIQHMGELKQPTSKLILIGGCSRAGKSTLAKALENELNAMVVNLDNWIVSIEKRKPKSEVIERYDGNDAIVAVESLLRGASVLIPKYDSKSRRRLDSRDRLYFNSDFLIVEGVLALAYPQLRSLAALSIYVETDDETRKDRVLSFYQLEKGLPLEEVQDLIAEREGEEVPFIRGTREYAQLIYSTKK